MESTTCMAQETNCPRYRHDGTSPLPLGMDVSTAPLCWNGVSTIWPQDFRSGWSYCVTIPSWRTMPQRKGSDGNAINPTVFYRLQVGVQSPQGISTTYELFRRFSDFLKLFAALKTTFPEKKLPSAPPKNALMRINSSQALLQERRRALQMWIESLLADIDISRSVSIATFLELEAAARFAVNTITDQQGGMSVSKDFSNPVSSELITPSRTPGVPWTEASSSVSSSPYPSGVDDGNSTTFGIPMIYTPSRDGDNVIELEMEALALEQEAASSRADDSGIKPTQKDELRGIPEAPAGRIEADDLHSVRHSDDDGDSQQHTGGRRAEANGTLVSTLPGFAHATPSDSAAYWHRRKGSHESLTSDFESVRGNDPTVSPSIEGNMMERWEDGLLEIESVLKGGGALSPADQQSKLWRLFVLMQRKILAAKADKEDLSARLNQETLVKEFLAIKVRDLESELDNTRRKSREVLQLAVSTERERVTSLQWELEESRNTLMNFEESSGVEKIRSSLEDAVVRAKGANEEALNEIAVLKEKQEKTQRERDLIEAQARVDKKVLVKEVKSLRNAQADLIREIDLIKQGKVDLQSFLQEQRRKKGDSGAKFLLEVANLRHRLMECSVDHLAREGACAPNECYSGGSLVLDLLTTSNNRIGLLLAEAQLLSKRSKEFSSSHHKITIGGGVHSNETESVRLDVSQDIRRDEAESDDELRQTISDLIIDNAQLQIAMNHLLTQTIFTLRQGDKDAVDATLAPTIVLSQFLGST